MKNLSALVVKAIMLVIMKVVFSGTGSGTGIGVGIGRDVRSDSLMFIFCSRPLCQGRTNERADPAACGKPPECKYVHFRVPASV